MGLKIAVCRHVGQILNKRYKETKQKKRKPNCHFSRARSKNGVLGAK